MSKASSRNRQLIGSWRSHWDIPRKLRLNKRDWQKIKRWIVISLAIALMWWWHWKLLLATIVGIGLMSLSYLLPSRSWQKYCVRWQRYLTGLNRRLVTAVASGGVGGFSTYLAASIWADAENRWLTTGLILQGFATVITLGLLIGYLWQGKQHSQEFKVDKLLDNLTDREPVKRLIAIRQLTRLLKNNYLSEEYYWQAIEYYQLMLATPQVPTVKQALLDSLDELNIGQHSQGQPKPINIPMQLSKNYQFSTIEEK
ncbi:MAG: ATP synthase subunit I [Pleurocapsa sp.]